MKNTLTILMIMIMGLMMSACGVKQKAEGVIKDVVKSEKIEDAMVDNQDDESVDDDIELISDDKKLVFNIKDVYQAVYYYEGQKITGMYFYYNFEKPELAKATALVMKSEAKEEDNYDSVTTKGNYVIIKFKAAAYETLTVKNLKASYAIFEVMAEDEN